MEFPSFDILIEASMAALRQLGESASNQEINERVIEDLQLPSEVVDRPHKSDTSRSHLEYMLSWARTYLKKSGLIMNSKRGVWALTPEGQRAGDLDAKEIIRHYNKILSERHAERDATTDEDALGAEALEGDVEDAEWRSTLRQVLLNMPPDGFERLSQRLLRESGFTQVEVTGRSGDGGIDGVGIIRLAGMLSFPVVFQCKRYKGSVGASTVRDFRGAMVGRADKGLIITTAGFTRDARNEATRDGAPPIDLVDGEMLMDKLQELELGVKTETVQVHEVDEEWFKGL